MSHVTCPVSGVTDHMLGVTFRCHISLLVEGLLSTGPTPSSFLKYLMITKVFDLLLTNESTIIFFLINPNNEILGRFVI